VAGPEPVRHPWEDWTWDETVFQGTSAYYRQGRTPYAPGLADALQQALDLDGHGRLLDLGCGPGKVTLLFAHLFGEVVGLDADPGMLAEAELAADEERVTNATWVRLRAEDLPADLGRFRVITLAQSFHWMDRPRVAAAAHAMLDPGGAVVHVGAWHQAPPELQRAGPHPPIPEAAIDELRMAYLGPDRRAGQGFRNTSPSGEDEVFQAAGFAPEEEVVVPDDRILERTADDIVAWVLSASSTAPHLFGDRLPEFERDLRTVLADASPDGLFSVTLGDNSLRIHRPR
jgi:SAM-dependent methyltransferase